FRYVLADRPAPGPARPGGHRVLHLPDRLGRGGVRLGLHPERQQLHPRLRPAAVRAGLQPALALPDRVGDPHHDPGRARLLRGPAPPRLRPHRRGYQGMSDPTRSWSRDAVIYEIYVRSFADSDGDGIGDLRGITQRLDHLVDLGVDAVWLTPFYRSPMADGGYVIADHRDVDPMFGTLADFDALLAAAHARGLRVIIDIVPNHVSSQHPWFVAA